jgi:hypothetical protein
MDFIFLVSWFFNSNFFYFQNYRFMCLHVFHNLWCSFCWFKCRGWRPLIFYTGLHILALYLDQLPLSLPESIADAADYLGLFKISNLQLGWPEGCQVVSLISLYTLVIPSSSIYVIAISYLVRLNHWVWGERLCWTTFPRGVNACTSRVRADFVSNFFKDRLLLVWKCSCHAWVRTYDLSCL